MLLSGMPDSQVCKFTGLTQEQINEIKEKCSDNQTTRQMSTHSYNKSMNMKENDINKLISDNLNFVKSIANKYTGKGLEFDDLVSEGYMAMVQAAQKFDANRGTNFVGYAAPFIRKAMEQAIDQQAGVCKVPKSDRKFACRSANNAVSIDAPLSEGAHYTLLDVLVNKDALMADDNAAFREMLKDLQATLQVLDDREKEVIEKFYGIGIAHVTLAEIGEDMGLKRERVRQIRDIALRKISKNAKTKALKSFLKK